MAEREFDIVLWGASGFTGQLVAEYLLGRYGVENSFRWALGGRNERKLDAVRDALDAPALPLVLGDGDDAASLDALASRSRVVCTTVGPYARYGSKLVAACAKAGTHYCDLTGELHWIRRMIDAHQDDAVRSGALLVPTCGFDSIPSDLGTFFVQREMRARDGAPSPHVKAGAAAFSGGFSGGTVASMLFMMEDAAKDPSIRRIMADPYAIDPDGGAKRPPSPDRTGPAWDEDFGQWTAPFVMAGINTRVVRRSNALLGDAYGRDFRYDEFTLTGAGPAGGAKAAALSAGTLLAMGSMALGPIRRLVAPRLPAPGEGPSREEQEKGFWEMLFYASSPRGDDAPGLRARLAGDRDPGYGSTSKMLGEAAVALALDAPDAVGFHTPASALGDGLIDRLQKSAGVAFEVLD
ncbi:MAG: saccharopine dehydrogenase family protein [Myxococcota bacterium]